MKIGCGEARTDFLGAAILGDVYALAAFQKEDESPTALFTISFRAWSAFIRKAGYFAIRKYRKIFLLLGHFVVLTLLATGAVASGRLGSRCPKEAYLTRRILKSRIRKKLRERGKSDC
jgi:hypothetical protein